MVEGSSLARASWDGTDNGSIAKDAGSVKETLSPEVRTFSPPFLQNKGEDAKREVEEEADQGTETETRDDTLAATEEEESALSASVAKSPVDDSPSVTSVSSKSSSSVISSDSSDIESTTTSSEAGDSKSNEKKATANQEVATAQVGLERPPLPPTPLGRARSGVSSMRKSITKKVPFLRSRSGPTKPEARDCCESFPVQKAGHEGSLVTSNSDVGPSQKTGHSKGLMTSNSDVGPTHKTGHKEDLATIDGDAGSVQTAGHTGHNEGLTTIDGNVVPAQKADYKEFLVTSNSDVGPGKAAGYQDDLVTSNSDVGPAAKLATKKAPSFFRSLSNPMKLLKRKCSEHEEESLVSPPDFMKDFETKDADHKGEELATNESGLDSSAADIQKAYSAEAFTANRRMSGSSAHSFARSAPPLRMSSSNPRPSDVEQSKESLPSPEDVVEDARDEAHMAEPSLSLQGSRDSKVHEAGSKDGLVTKNSGMASISLQGSRDSKVQEAGSKEDLTTKNSGLASSTHSVTQESVKNNETNTVDSEVDRSFSRETAESTTGTRYEDSTGPSFSRETVESMMATKFEDSSALGVAKDASFDASRSGQISATSSEMRDPWPNPWSDETTMLRSNYTHTPAPMLSSPQMTQPPSPPVSVMESVVGVVLSSGPEESHPTEVNGEDPQDGPVEPADNPTAEDETEQEDSKIMEEPGQDDQADNKAVQTEDQKDECLNEFIEVESGDWKELLDKETIDSEMTQTASPAPIEKKQPDQKPIKKLSLWGHSSTKAKTGRKMKLGFLFNPCAKKSKSKKTEKKGFFLPYESKEMKAKGKSTKTKSEVVGEEALVPEVGGPCSDVVEEEESCEESPSMEVQDDNEEGGYLRPSDVAALEAALVKAAPSLSVPEPAPVLESAPAPAATPADDSVVEQPSVTTQTTMESIMNAMMPRAVSPNPEEGKSDLVQVDTDDHSKRTRSWLVDLPSMESMLGPREPPQVQRTFSEASSFGDVSKAEFEAAAPSMLNNINSFVAAASKSLQHNLYDVPAKEMEKLRELTCIGRQPNEERTVSLLDRDITATESQDSIYHVGPRGVSYEQKKTKSSSNPFAMVFGELVDVLECGTSEKRMPSDPSIKALGEEKREPIEHVGSR